MFQWIKSVLGVRKQISDQIISGFDDGLTVVEARCKKLVAELEQASNRLHSTIVDAEYTVLPHADVKLLPAPKPKRVARKPRSKK